MSSINEKENIFFQLSEEIKIFNEMLLSTSWKKADLDNCIFENETGYTKLSKPQNNLVTKITEYMPEWKRLINCKQHCIHDYCLDIHTLAVIKNIQNHEDYEKLNQIDKLILIYSALLHDIEKNENEIDPEHAVKGAKKSSSILYRLGFDEDFINTVYLIIRYHQILGLIVSGKLKFSDDEMFDMFKQHIIVDLQVILSVSDIKSVKKDGSFYEEDFNSKFKELKEKIKIIINSNL